MLEGSEQVGEKIGREKREDLRVENWEQAWRPRMSRGDWVFKEQWPKFEVDTITLVSAILTKRAHCTGT